jgi:C_GCAxxG_C_C family probable redox protein
MDNIQQAVTLMKTGHSCSQSVLAGFSQRVGLDYDLALMISRGFGGKCGSQGLCGAVVGAHMVLGMIPPLDVKREDKKTPCRNEVYRLVQEFNKQFKKRYEHLNCCDLLGLNPATKVGNFEARARGLFKKRCREYVKGAAEILEGQIQELSQPDQECAG